jgi:hypothetical protein
MHRQSYSQLSRVFVAALAFAIAGCGGDRNADRQETATGEVAGERARVTNVELGRGVGTDNRITDRTDDFRPVDTIYASVMTDGSGANQTIMARWTFEDGQVVDESSRTLSGTAGEVIEFHVSRPGGWPTGRYTLHILLNGEEVETRDFRVS